MSDMLPTDLARLAEIIEHGTRIGDWLKGKNELQFLEDPMLRDAVSMNLLIIGEAASNLSDDLKRRSGEAIWEDVRGLRNRVAHGYGSIDWTRIWFIATRDAPSLVDLAKRLRGG
jgi:uncharacterized protein with HEPN domain